MASAHVHAGVSAMILASLVVAFPSSDASAVSPAMQQYQRETAQRLLEFEQVVNFDAATLTMLEVSAQPGEPFMVDVKINGAQQVLDLQPHSVRAPNYQVLAQIEDGSFVVSDPGVERTLRGRLAGVPDSTVAASLLEDGLHALVIMPDGERIWIEPVGPAMPDNGPGLYIVYRNSDVLPIEAGCGVKDALIGHEVDAGHFENPLAGEGGVAGGLCIAELACDADREYFLNYGSVSATQNRINAVINAVNIQYEAQVALTHSITQIIVRTAEPDPYSSTSSDTLLCQFITEWTNNQGGVQRDVAHLFTGKSLSGSVIGQAADIGDICNNNGCCSCGQFGTDGSYCLAESDFSGSFSCATDLSAHELGHLWGAFHCSCPGNTMNPSITCANNFSAATVNAIINYRNTLGCLGGSCGTPGGPDNDNCSDAEVITNGVFAYSTLNATTDGPANPVGVCNDFDENQTHHDIWYRYQATCTGELTVTTCDDIHGAGDPTYDTDLVLYGPYGSPGSISCSSSSLSANRLACNDDDPVNSCGTGEPFSSTIQADVTAGSYYLIRVGGWANGEQGNGFLGVDCVGTEPQAEPIPFNTIILKQGTNVSGGLTQMAASDNQYYSVDSIQVNAKQQSHFFVRLNSPVTTVQEMNVTVELRGITSQPNTKSRIYLRDWANGGWDRFEVFVIPTSDTVKMYANIPNPSDYIRSNNGDVRVRVLTSRGNTTTPFTVLVDHIEVTIVP